MGGGNTKTRQVRLGKDIKLYYFDVYSRGEAIRMILNHNKVQFEDVRITQEQWGEKKGTFEFSQVPILQVDGKQMAQSNAIARYLAQSQGQYPTDALEIYQVEATLSFLEDVNSTLGHMLYNPAQKSDVEEFFKKSLIEPMVHLNNILKQNKTGSGFFVGKSLTLADFCVVNFATRIITHPDRIALSPPIFAAVPEFEAYLKKITEGTFKVYLSNRKYAPF